MKCNNCGHEKKKHYKLGKNHEGYCKEKDCTCNWFEQKPKQGVDLKKQHTTK